MNRLFSIGKKYSKDKKHIIITLLGIKFTFSKKRKKKKIEIEDIHNLILGGLNVLEQDMNVLYYHSQTFPKYKNINTGKTVVLCGAGPSLRQYKPIEGAIHVGLNRAIFYEDIKFDYFFAHDWKGIYNIANEIAEYKGNNCIKFIGTQGDLLREEIPESFVSKFKCERYITDNHRFFFNGNVHKFTQHLASQPLGNFGTIAFPAMQFIMWTNPEKVYIVGCDTAPVGHFTGEVLPDNARAMNDGTYPKLVNQWKQFKEFADFHYPDIKIASINPVGLKGIFEDIYTE